MFDDNEWMKAAIAEANKAAAAKEVPVGAVVVLDNSIVGRGFNQCISSCDPTAHAEIIALRDAAKTINNYRLVDASLYVTLEPCTMCVGAMIHSRIARLVYGASEPKAGAIKSQQQLLDEAFFNHKIEVCGGVYAEQCSDVLRSFFAKRREQIKRNKKALN